MPTPPADPLDRAIAEVDSMRAIAELLAALPDHESRARVLRWLADHFYGSPGAPLLPANDDRQRLAACSGNGQQGDPALTIGEDVFDTPSRPAHEATDAFDEIPELADPDDETVHCDALTVDETFFEREEIREADLRLDDEGIEPVRSEPRQAGGGLDALLRDFVADFQRLALEWQTA